VDRFGQKKGHLKGGKVEKTKIKGEFQATVDVPARREGTFGKMARNMETIRKEGVLK